MLKLFSVLMDESNGKTDKSCNILVRLPDTNESDVHTRFLDMPIVNISTAQNFSELSKNHLILKG